MSHSDACATMSHPIVVPLPDVKPGVVNVLIVGSIENVMVKSLLGIGEYESLEECRSIQAAWYGMHRSLFYIAYGHPNVVDACCRAIESSNHHAIVIADRERSGGKIEKFLGKSLQSFVRRGGRLVFLSSDGQALQDSLQRLFNTCWLPSSYHRTDFQCVRDNLSWTGCTLSDVCDEFSAKACAVRAVPLHERIYTTTTESRTQSHVPFFAGHLTSSRHLNCQWNDIVVTCVQVGNSMLCTRMSGEEIAKLEIPLESEPYGNWLIATVLHYIVLEPGHRLVLVDSEAQVVSQTKHEDCDVCIAAHKYGDGVVAYVGDVNMEIESCMFVLAFCRNSALVPFSIGRKLVVRGLRAKPEHNGKVVEVVGYQVDRIQVRLMGQYKTEMALKRENLEQISAVKRLFC